MMERKDTIAQTPTAMASHAKSVIGEKRPFSVPRSKNRQPNKFSTRTAQYSWGSMISPSRGSDGTY
jgi:hypothetical protein